MSNDRWMYQVLEISPKFLRIRVDADRIQEELNRLGAQGWELVTAIHVGGRGLGSMQLFLKRPQ